jgi:hypothetical protein
MSLYTLTTDLLMKTGAFECDSVKAAGVVQRDMTNIRNWKSCDWAGADEWTNLNNHLRLVTAGQAVPFVANSKGAIRYPARIASYNWSAPVFAPERNPSLH